MEKRAGLHMPLGETQICVILKFTVSIFGADMERCPFPLTMLLLLCILY